VIRLLRRFQPQNVALGILYWLLWAVVALGGLFLTFFYLDSVLELGGGMF
jgi:hypothetical protein